jgi:hypothetical protein
MSDSPNQPRASLALLLLLALVALAGCSSSSDPAPERPPGASDSTEASRDPCEPRRFDGEVEDPPRRDGQGGLERVEIGSSELGLEAVGTAFPRSIPISFAEREPFEAPKGSMLVAISYRIENEARGELKPSEDLNPRLLLRASGALYPHAAGLPCGIPLAASWAVAHGGDNPAVPVAPGGSARSAVVFIVPKQETGTRLSLVLPGQVGIALPPIG